MSWIGKSFHIQCPNCTHNVEIRYSGQISRAFTSTAEADLKLKRKFRPPYRQWLDASKPGDFWDIAPNRLSWFTWASGPWLRRNPYADLKAESLPDGSVKFTRTR